MATIEPSQAAHGSTAADTSDLEKSKVMAAVVEDSTSRALSSEQNQHNGKEQDIITQPVEKVLADEHQLTLTPTNDVQNEAFPLPAAKRVRTAPAAEARRPQLLVPRRTSMLAAKKLKQRAATTIYSSRHGGFEYIFDAIESDSDDSSSDTDTELPTPVVRTSSARRKEEERDKADEANLPENQERRRFLIGNDFFRTKGRVSRKDGRLKISINETANSGYIAKALGQSVRNHLDIPRSDHAGAGETTAAKKKKKLEDRANAIDASLHTKHPRPKLNIVIMVIGSRGDIQPFLKVGKLLQDNHGHHVRIASHPVFKEFVEKTGLEFFDIGGDPSELMAFMVKNPGLIPGIQTLREGEISKRRAAMGEMFEGFWRSCIADTVVEDGKGGKSMTPFVADAIIANPPSMAHVHCAERLGIPLHIMFTFPYTPTTQFSHPLANIKARKSNVDVGYVNFMSYPLVEMMTWSGLGDIVNRFRENTLRLEPVSSLWAPGALYRMKVPYTYMWSPSLCPKPSDWGPEIDIAGFVFLDLAKYFEPPEELAAFLDAGEPPVYIGFGSIVVDDPNKFTDMILEAVKMAGVRALISKGWGGLGRDNNDTPENVYMLGNIPHDWLFPRVRAVVHHGGAGTTAIGLKCARPTMIVPFFGDQPFWGNMVAEAKAGAYPCIPYKKLTAERLAEGIRQCLTEEAQQNAQKIADSIGKEGDGAENAVASFLRSLPMAGRHSMRCSILQDRVAVWKVKKSSLRLSALAAEMLHQEGKFKWSELKLIRHYAWNDFDGPGEPITGGVGALTDSLYGIGEGFGMVPIRIARHIRKREEHERKKRERQRRREQRAAEKAERIEASSSPTATHRPHLFHSKTEDTMGSVLSAEPMEPLPREVIDDLNWGLKRAGAAILTMPNDFSVAIAQGIHNAPRLWGDGTVRKPIKIHGVKSGFTAARKEFAYGIYDGWTGLVTQPRGDWEDGDTFASKLAGLGTGVGKGVGGFVFKNLNALWAPPAYLVQGLIKHIEKKSDGPGSKPFIRRSRILQGENELRVLEKQSSSSISSDYSQNIQSITDRVMHGWNVYQDIWLAAEQTFGPLGPLAGNVMGKYKMERERKKWDVNGALENVDIAKQVLQAKEEGQDVETVLDERRKDLDAAELPRESVMENPATAEEKGMDADAVGKEKGLEEKESVLTSAGGSIGESRGAMATDSLPGGGVEGLDGGVTDELRRPTLKSAATVA